MPAPIKHTCLDIDRLQRRVKSVVADIKNVVDDPKVQRDIIWELDEISDSMEELRKANASLREWGEELEKELADKDEEIYSLEMEMNKIQQTA